MKFRDPGARWKWAPKCHPKAQATKNLGPPRSYSCLMDSFYIHPHSFLAYASLEDLPMMSQRRTYSSLFTDVASLREDVVRLPYFLLNLAMPRGSCENQPNSKCGFQSYMPAIRWCVRQHTPIPLQNVFLSAGIWLNLSHFSTLGAVYLPKKTNNTVRKFILIISLNLLL